MSLMRFKRKLFAPLFALCCLLLMAAEGLGQSAAGSTAAKDVDLEIKLYLLVGSNGAGDAAKPPAQLDRAVRQLSSSLPFNSYRWAGTFISRVSNGMSSSTKGVAGPLLATTPPTSGTPSFYDLTLGNVSLTTGPSGQELVRFMLQYGARLPVAVGGGGGAPAAINYEGTGVKTTVNIREDEPVVVGTMSLGASNETLVLVVVARRIS